MKRNHVGRGAAAARVEGLESRTLLSTTLPLGGTVPGAIDGVGEVDEYTFTVPAQAKVRLFGTALGTTGTFAARFKLLGPGTGSAKPDLGHFDVVSGGVGSRQIDSLPQAGTYTVRVYDSALRDRGSYRLGLEGINPISTNPGQVVKGGIVGGNIDSAIDVKQYVFDAAAGDKVQLTGTALGKTGTFTARFKLWGPGGQDLRHFDVVSGRTGSRRIDSLPLTGRYMVEVYDSALRDAGSFSLGFESVKPASPDAVPLTNGRQVTASTTSPIEIRQYVFNGNAGDRVTFTGTALGTTGTFTARFKLWGPGGQDLGHFDVVSGRTASRAVPTLPETGRYVVEVYDSALADVGRFTLVGQGLRGSDPVIAGLLASPSPAAAGTVVTLTAAGVSDADNDVKSVAFYRESNGRSGLQTGAGGDAVVATDTTPSDGWKSAFSTAPLAPRAYTYYAQAADATGRMSNVVSASHTVTPPPAATVGIVASDPFAAESAFGAASGGMFTLYRKGDASKPVSVVLQLGGTAAHGADFTFAVGGAASWSFDAATRRLTVTLASNARAASVAVNAVNDNLIESAESVQLSLLTSSAFAPEAGRSSATVTVNDRLQL
jgi:uncharacterized lipoprotein YbaY